MKKYILLFGMFLTLFGCEKPSDCIESSGATIIRQVDVVPFTRVEVYKGIEVIITEGPVYSVTIETGENLIENVEVTQHDNVLLLRDNSTCNWVREYGETKVHITAPNITEIYSKSDRNISSNGVLSYPDLQLISVDNDGDGVEGAGTGDFYLVVNNNNLTVGCNNVSRFYLSGQTNNAYFDVYSGDGRIEAPELAAQNIKIFHRGSNDMIVKPIQRIYGTLYSTGNVILKNNPPVVDVQQLYQGHLIYN